LAKPDGVYRVSTALRVLAVCFLGPMVVLGTVGPIWIQLTERPPHGNPAFLVVLGLIGATFFSFLAWAIFRTKLEFLPTGIRYTGSWGKLAVPWFFVR
jgi:hypothetical protein